MNDLATIDAFGAVTEPATLTIQRLLPGPVERIWSYLTVSDLRRRWLAAGEMTLKLGAPLGLETLPVVRGRNANVAIVGRLRVFIRHLQEDQVGELL